MRKRKIEYVYLIHTLNRMISNDVRLNFFNGEEKIIDLIFLSVIDYEPGINPQNMCKKVIYDASFVSRKLSYLRKREYIYREKKERITQVYITEKGIKLLEEYHENMREVVRVTMMKKDINIFEMKKNLKILKKILQSLVYLGLSRITCTFNS